MFKDVFKNFKSHCMTGISYMIPVIVIGGFCTAIARLCGNVDVQGTLGYAFISAGNAKIWINDVRIMCRYCLFNLW